MSQELYEGQPLSTALESCPRLCGGWTRYFWDGGGVILRCTNKCGWEI